jgi:hypothetical protein
MAVTEVSANGGDPVAEQSTSLRARLVSVTVQLNLVTDDGTNLDPIPVQPIQVRAVDWPQFDLGLQLADVQRQLDESAVR